MSERSNIAEPLLVKADRAELTLAELEAVRTQLDSAHAKILDELELTSQGLDELEQQLQDGVGDSFALMHLGLDELRHFLQNSQPAQLRLARLLFEKGDDEYRGLQGRLKRIEMHASSSDLPGQLWTRVLEQSGQEVDLSWAEAEFSAHAQQWEIAFRSALDCLGSDPSEAERQIELLRLRLTQLLL